MTQTCEFQEYCEKCTGCDIIPVPFDISPPNPLEWRALLDGMRDDYWADYWDEHEECPECGHIWRKRVLNPNRCPKCRVRHISQE